MHKWVTHVAIKKLPPSPIDGDVKWNGPRFAAFNQGNTNPLPLTATISPQNERDCAVEKVYR